MAEKLARAIEHASGCFSIQTLIAEAERRGPIEDEADLAFPSGTAVEQLEDGSLFALLAYRLRNIGWWAMSANAPSPAPASGGEPIKADKGQFNGSCNRHACQRPGATWYNTATYKYYCPECARRINDGAGLALCLAQSNPAHPDFASTPPAGETPPGVAEVVALQLDAARAFARRAAAPVASGGAPETPDDDADYIRATLATLRIALKHPRLPWTDEHEMACDRALPSTGSEDTARLDWLEAHSMAVPVLHDTAGWRVKEPTTFREHKELTLRAAIDAAMSATPLPASGESK